MFSIPLALCLLLVSMVVSYWSIVFLLNILKSQQVMDIPNERSNHKLPTPRGAGIALVLSIGLIWPSFGAFFTSSFLYNLAITVLVLILGIISFIDDKKSLSPKIRLPIHLLVAATMVFVLMPMHNILLPDNISFVIEKLAITLFITYFINAYNFMDGIDGITAINTLTVLFGMSLLIILQATGEYYMYLNALIIGFCFIFLLFNWNPAKIFLGDVGSIPLGFLVALEATYLAYHGQIWSVIIINSYYITDTIYTIAKRLKNKENIFEAHSQHIYQKLIRSGRFSVKQVSLGVGLLNVLLSLIIISFIY